MGQMIVCAGTGSIATRPALQPYLNSSAAVLIDALQYQTTLALTRAATYKIIPLLNASPAASLDASAPFTLTIAPDIPTAALSSVTPETALVLQVSKPVYLSVDLRDQFGNRVAAAANPELLVQASISVVESGQQDSWLRKLQAGWQASELRLESMASGLVRVAVVSNVTATYQVRYGSPLFCVHRLFAWSPGPLPMTS